MRNEDDYNLPEGAGDSSAGHADGGGGLADTPSSPEDGDHLDAANANLEISLGARFPSVRFGVRVPGIHAPRLLQIATYGLGGALIIITLVGGQLLGFQLWVTGPLALLELLGCAYLLVTRR